jgi:hypothetical protein
MPSARAHLESLLKDRKLDVTLTTATPLAWELPSPDADLAATGVPQIDGALGGGLRRGHLSEVIGHRSTGRTGVVCHALSAAASRGELTALIDTSDRFDPQSAASLGVDLSRLLWIRETGDVPRALKATNLVLQAGGFGLVVLDVADAQPRAVRSLPFTTWFRLARVIEGSQTVAMLLATEHLARSSGGATIDMDDVAPVMRPRVPVVAPATTAARARWTGSSDRARLLEGLAITPRVIGARR